MSTQQVFEFISDNRQDLIEKWTSILSQLGENDSLKAVNEQMFRTICEEYMAIILTSPETNDEYTDKKIFEFAVKIVQLGLSLKLIAQALADFWKYLYRLMDEKSTSDKQSLKLVWEIEENITPINNEILNQYSISWEKTVSLQKEALQELSAPLIPVFERVTVMPLVGTIDTERAKRIMENLLHGVVKHRSEVVLIDITGVPVVDTMVAHHIIQASEAVRLVGARCLLVGIRPEIAQTIVTLGIDLSQVITKNTLQKGIQTALEMTNRKIVPLGELVNETSENSYT
ncbi:STAS domain-containing protein [Bacillus gobiensis]|uniref:STAS domain-containing protein n=1 Tax=Bacillus gobiensis TaxID=1441095 RepID=UPI003D23C79C